MKTSFPLLWGAMLALFCSSMLVSHAADVEVIVGNTVPNPGDAPPAGLNAPFAVDFDAQGAMIIVEYDGGRLLKWTAADGLETLAGATATGYVDGAGETARFNKLHNVTIGADGQMYLSDHLNHAVRVYDPAKRSIDSFAGNGKEGFDGDSGSIDEARFRQPICVSLTADRKQLLVADIGNRRIRQIDLATERVRTIAGNGKKGRPADGELATEAPLVDPRAAAAAPDGSWYLLERGGHVLRHVRDGRVTTVAGNGKPGLVDGPALSAQLNGPKHLDIASDGRVFIADDNNHAVRVYDPATQTLQTVSTGNYKLKRPHGVKVHLGELYIADSFHHRILKLALPDAP